MSFNHESANASDALPRGSCDVHLGLRHLETSCALVSDHALTMKARSSSMSILTLEHSQHVLVGAKRGTADHLSS